MVKLGHRAVMVYLVQREDCVTFKIAKDIDPGYHDAFVKATNRGVEHLCYSCRLTTKSICIDKRIRMIR